MLRSNPGDLFSDEQEDGQVSDAQTTDDTARLNWYRSAIDGDPARRERFTAALARFDTTLGKSDDLDELDRLLDH